MTTKAAPMQCAKCDYQGKPQMVNGAPSCPRCGGDMTPLTQKAAPPLAAPVAPPAPPVDRERKIIQSVYALAKQLVASIDALQSEEGGEAEPEEDAAPAPHAEPDADEEGGPSDDDADNTPVPPAKPRPVPPQLAKSALNLTYVKSLRLSRDDQWFRDVAAVKSIGADAVKGYMVLWGSPDLVDVEQDFFTKRTDFWDTRLGYPRPLTWDHAQDDATKGAPVIGQIVAMGDDDTGRWYEAQLDRTHKYRKAIDRLIAQRAVGTSSDSAPQYVVRERAKSGANWIKQWPLFAGALTGTPAEPRMFDTLHFKAIGVTLPKLADASHDAAREDAALVNALARYEILRRL